MSAPNAAMYYAVLVTSTSDACLHRSYSKAREPFLWYVGSFDINNIILKRFYPQSLHFSGVRDNICQFHQTRKAKSKLNETLDLSHMT